jgi:mRNA interferase MazF
MPIQRGDIYFVNLNPVQGREQAGQRPVLVLSIDAINRLPLVVTVVVDTKGENITRDYPTNVRLSPAESGLPMETVFLGFQVRSLDPKRFSSPPAGRVTGAVLRRDVAQSSRRRFWR